MSVTGKASTGVTGLSVATGRVVRAGESKTLVDILSKILVRLLLALTSKKVSEVAKHNSKFYR